MSALQPEDQGFNLTCFTLEMLFTTYPRQCQLALAPNPNNTALPATKDVKMKPIIYFLNFIYLFICYYLSEDSMQIL